MYCYLPSANCGACERLCYLDEECISHHSREVIGLISGVTCWCKFCLFNYTSMQTDSAAEDADLEVFPYNFSGLGKVNSSYVITNLAWLPLSLP